MSETLRTNIVVNDGMTPALRGMMRSLNLVINSFQDMQSISGNAVDLTSINAARSELARVETAFNGVEREIMQANEEQQRFNDEIRNGQGAADGLGRSIKRFIGMYLGVQGIRQGARVVNDWLGFADVQIASEKQLATVMRNMGATKDAFEAIKRTASDIQLNTTFGDEALLGGAGELATYLESGQAIEAMMGTMSNYAAGMGGMEVDKAGMVEYATQLGKALDGQFDGLSKKGFVVSEAQKKIIENGTEMERVAVITDIINQSWNGLAESLANTPQGQLLQMENTFGDIKEVVGMHLQPYVLHFFQILNANMPTAEALMMGFANAAIFVMLALGKIVEVASPVVSFFVDNWSMIAPIILGVAGALAFHKAILIASSVATAISVGWQTAQAIALAATTIATVKQAAEIGNLTVAQWALNSAMYANPIFWVIAGIIILIGILYAAVAAYNHFTGASISATGIVAGAFMFLVGFLRNIFFGLLEFVLGILEVWLNAFIAFANFLANVFSNPLTAIVRMFGDMGDAVLGILASIAGAIDFVFGSNLQGAVEGWRDNLGGFVAKISGDNYTEVFDKVDLSLGAFGIERLEYNKLWDKGYDWGSNFSIFPDMPEIPDPSDVFDDPFEGDIGDIGDIKDDTGKIKKSLEKSEDELKALRDLATIKAINRFSFDGINVNVSQRFGDIHQAMDLDGIGDVVINKLENVLDEFIATSAEGAYDV